MKHADLTNRDMERIDQMRANGRIFDFIGRQIAKEKDRPVAYLGPSIQRAYARWQKEQNRAGENPRSA